MKSAVIGLGETGRPLFEILQEAYGDDVEGIDIKDGGLVELNNLDFDIVNICIPYSDYFIEIVESYQKCFNPSLIIIHSTVPIGTTSKIKNAVHSPILGRHNRMDSDLRHFIKWIGGEQAEDAAMYLRDADLFCKTVKKSEITEALKLMCLAKYGMSIAFAEYQKEICDKYDFPYALVRLWDTHYNLEVEEDLKRPVLYPPNGHIGGHCILPNTKILNEQHPNPILKEILKYE